MERDGGVPNIPDTGCEFAPRCLECGLPACRYDLPPRVAGTLLRMTALTRFEREGLTAEELAARIGVSRRTAFRLKRDRTREPYRTLLRLVQAGTGSGTLEVGPWTSESP
jgi:hypothetical protein